MEDTETDCREVLKKLSVYLDGEAQAADAAEIDAHLVACGECMQHADFERDLKALVRRKCSEGTPPQNLVERLKARIDEAAGE